MTIRVVPYQKADAEHAVAFFAEAGQADPDLKPPTLADWRSFVGQGGNHGGTDFAFAEQDGKTVALLMSARYPEEGRELRNFRIVVLSSHRRQGIGGRLFDVVLAQDPDGDAILQSTCHRSWKAGTRFLETREFRSVRDVFYMIALAVPEPPPLHDRVRLRDYAPGTVDNAAWRRLHDEAYAGGPDYSPMDDEELSLLRARGGFQLRFAEVDGQSIGFCQTSEYADQIYINSLGLTPAWRGHGVGKSLLLDGIARLRERGYSDVRLTVRGDNLPAVGLYRDVGFEAEDVATTWWRE